MPGRFNPEWVAGLNRNLHKNCGSKFNLLEIEGDPGYIITSNGPVKVIGSSVPDFDDLSPEKKLELLKQCEVIIKKNKK
jgi:hypothetical protein